MDDFLIRDGQNLFREDDSPVFREALSPEIRQRVRQKMLTSSRFTEEEKNTFSEWLSSPACAADLAGLIHGEKPLPEPKAREIRIHGNPRTVYSLPWKEQALLALVNQALSCFDGCFSEHLYSHIRGRHPRNALSAVRNDPDFAQLYLFKTDIRHYGESIDAGRLSAAVGTLPGMDGSLHAFLDRQIFTTPPAVKTGLPLTGFFENVYLRELDEYMDRNAAFYARCVDDILIGAGSRQELERLVGRLRNTMADAKLYLNETKTRYVMPGESFSYLGWQINAGEIDFTPEALSQMRRACRQSAIRLLRRYKAMQFILPIRLMMIIRFADQLAAQFGIPEAFLVVSVPDGLREIDRMLCDMIRTAASGKTGKGKYRISYQDLRSWGYRSLVRRYYQAIR